MGETKQCPYCAEEIKSAAIKCKHCQSMLEEKEEPKENNKLKKAIENFEKRVKQNYSKYEIGEKYIDKGEIVLKTNVSPFNGCVFMVLLFLGIIPGLLYALIIAQKNIKEPLTVELKSNGKVNRISRGHLKLAKKYNNKITGNNLISAIKNNNYQQTKQIIDNKQNIIQLNEKYKITASSIAESQKNDKIIQLLKEKGLYMFG